MRLPGHHPAFCGGPQCEAGSYGPDDVVRAENGALSAHRTTEQGVVEAFFRFEPDGDGFRGDGPESGAIELEYSLATEPDAAEHALAVAADPTAEVRVGSQICGQIVNCSGGICPMNRAVLRQVIETTRV